MNNSDKLINVGHLNTVLPVVKELIEDTNKSIKDTKLELRDEIEETKSSIIQSSWSQNDESALNYIKDRTHYMYKGRTVLVPKTEVSHKSLINDIDSVFSLEIGCEVIVCYDDVEYKCVIKKTSTGQLSYIHLGNLYLYLQNSSQTENTGEPFCIVHGGYCYFENSGTSHTIEILNTELSTQYSCLDENYIPDTIARISDIPKELLLYNEQNLNRSQRMQARKNMDLYSMDTELLLSKESFVFNGVGGEYCEATLQFPELVVGETYRIEFDKNNYYVGYAICDGDITSDEYTMIFYNTERNILCEYTNGYLRMNLPVASNFSKVFDVYLLKVNNINKISDVYIPDTVARVADMETYVEQSIPTKPLSSICTPVEDSTFQFTLDVSQFTTSGLWRYHDDLQASGDISGTITTMIKLYNGDTFIGNMMWVANQFLTIRRTLAGTYSFYHDSGRYDYDGSSSLTCSNFVTPNNVLTTYNTTEYTPTSDYHPATKAYVDAQIPTQEEIVTLLAETGFISPVTDANGDIFTDLNKDIIIF